MPQNRQYALLSGLKSELKFCELGGYRPVQEGFQRERARIIRS